MGLIAWILLGLIAGSIVRKIAPGQIEGGWTSSLVLGVAGAMVGGWIGSLLFDVNAITSLFSIKTWFFAIGGGVIVSYIYSFIKAKKQAA